VLLPGPSRRPPRAARAGRKKRCRCAGAGERMRIAEQRGLLARRQASASWKGGPLRSGQRLERARAAAAAGALAQHLGQQRESESTRRDRGRPRPHALAFEAFERPPATSIIIARAPSAGRRAPPPLAPPRPRRQTPPAPFGGERAAAPSQHTELRARTAVNPRPGGPRRGAWPGSYSGLNRMALAELGPWTTSRRGGRHDDGRGRQTAVYRRPNRVEGAHREAFPSYCPIVYRSGGPAPKPAD